MDNNLLSMGTIRVSMHPHALCRPAAQILGFYTRKTTSPQGLPGLKLGARSEQLPWIAKYNGFTDDKNTAFARCLGDLIDFCEGVDVNNEYDLGPFVAEGYNSSI